MELGKNMNENKKDEIMEGGGPRLVTFFTQLMLFVKEVSKAACTHIAQHL